MKASHRVAVACALAAAVPALSYAVGVVALPRPRAGADDLASATAGASGSVRSTPPTPNNPTLVILEDTVEILGADLPTTPVARGARLPITFHFGAKAEVDRDWQVFVHIDARRGATRIHGDHFPGGGKLPTSVWSRGSFIADVWQTTVPRDAATGEYDVWIGLYIGDERMRVTGGDTTRHDGQNRVRVGTVRVE